MIETRTAMHGTTTSHLGRRSHARWGAPGVILGVLCTACAPSNANEATSTTSRTAAAAYKLTIGERRLTLPEAEWRQMQDEAPFAKNFEARSNPPHRRSQVVTVFLIPMSDDRRSGQRLSPTEYVEVFMTTPGQVVVQVRSDHGSYWVLSREVFEAAAVPTVDLTSIRPLADVDVARITKALRLQVDTTRHLLGERLRAS